MQPTQLSAVWPQVEALLSAGVSIIPVRDKETPGHNGTPRPAKTAYPSWKKYQSTPYTIEELWHDMERFDTTAIAMICGAVSGNLEVIDIDIKHWPGVDARLFKDLSELYPDLWDRLRIHKSPSGGYHIIYRIDGQVPEGNKKIAYKADHKECGIETRGEGGYVLAPPSMGYAIHRAGSTGGIPVITPEERASIMALCLTYNEKVKLAPTYSATKYDNDYYDENPFEHFNRSPAGEEVLSSQGWEYFAQSGNFTQYTRTGKSTGVSATFDRVRRLYYFFTTSTDLEGGKWYNPATVLAALQFAGDKKATYRHLVAQGYGKIKPGREAQIAKRAADEGKGLPANASPEARTKHAALVTEKQTKYPAGIFWFVNDKDQTAISREKIYTVAEYLGFRVHMGSQVCRIDPDMPYLVHRVEDRLLWDQLKAYIKEEDGDDYEEICNAYEGFIQKSGAFTITRLPVLPLHDFIQSTKQTAYKYFKNCYLTITADGINPEPYPLPAGNYIWSDQVQPRAYHQTKPEVVAKGMFPQFLYHATGFTDTVKSAIGYLCHDFKDEEAGYIVVLTEQCPDPKLGGGSGKNVFSALLRHSTTYKNIPGTQIQYNEKFLQSWNFERVLSISDVPKKFDFSFLKELSTGTGVVKKLFKDEVTVGPSEMPKLLVSTNFSYEVSDGGLRRRIIPIEFTDFFTRSGGVNAYFKAMFPVDWTEEEWSAYDNTIAGCIQWYLSTGGAMLPPPLTSGGWTKQFEQSYGQLTFQFIEENIAGWCVTGKVAADVFNTQYDHFSVENNLNGKFKISSILMNRALEDYCAAHNIVFDKNVVERDYGGIKKYRSFHSKDNLLPESK